MAKPPICFALIVMMVILLTIKMMPTRRIRQSAACPHYILRCEHLEVRFGLFGNAARYPGILRIVCLRTPGPGPWPSKSGKEHDNFCKVAPPRTACGRRSSTVKNADSAALAVVKTTALDPDRFQAHGLHVDEVAQRQLETEKRCSIHC